MGGAATDRNGCPPLVEALASPPEPECAFRRLATRPHCLFLDSAQTGTELGRYSFLTADPLAFHTVTTEAAKPLRKLVASRGLENTTDPRLPPFQGGWAGLLSYDLVHSWEKVGASGCDEFRLPALAMGLYDVVLAYDHHEQAAWLISQGSPAAGSRAQRQRHAAERLRQFQSWLAESPQTTTTPNKNGSFRPPRTAQHRTQGPAELTSNFTADAYERAVARAIEYIHAGDIFQVNLSQRLLHPARSSSVDLYCRLRHRNPAPFAAYFDLGDHQIVSASPERFLRVREGCVEARPIKGTRQRTTLPEADLYAGRDLLLSEKDRAENIMIVDLMRNDLSQVCRDGSVQVAELCRLESYGFVQHLVSVVCGELAATSGPWDLVRAAFPAGSITGAPKVRAMEIITELERVSRGAYCGSLGYIAADGTLDLSVLIRTITASGGWWQLPVGGGIVAQSSPRREYEETWHKAEGMLHALS